MPRSWVYTHRQRTKRRTKRYTEKSIARVKELLGFWAFTVFWWVIASFILVNEVLATAIEKQATLPLELKQQLADGNMILVRQQAPFWVESFTLILITLVTAVVAPVVTMWAKKKFAVEKQKPHP